MKKLKPKIKKQGNVIWPIGGSEYIVRFKKYAYNDYPLKDFYDNCLRSNLFIFSYEKSKSITQKYINRGYIV